MSKIIVQRQSADYVDLYIAEQAKLQTLPKLSDLDRVNLENSIDVEHLYFSSKLEGTNLTKKQIEEAIK